MKIYVASSWRNTQQPVVVQTLVNAGHQVYDFRHPASGDHGFSWEQIDPQWQNWSSWDYRNALDHPMAQSGFKKDLAAMQWADACVLVLPCGRSAHLEAGWFAAQPDKSLAILLTDDDRPELMYRLADLLALELEHVIDWLRMGTEEEPGRRDRVTRST